MSSNSEMDTESAGSSRSEELVRGRGRRRGGRRGGVGGRGRRVGGRGRGVGGRGRGVGGAGRGGLATQVQPAESEQQRKDRVKELIANLTIERCREVLLETVDRQPGLILDVLDRIEPAQPGFHPPHGGPSQSWCSCGRCRDMPTVAERVCCGYMPDYCVSQLPDIARYILDEGVLNLARLFRREVLVYPDERDVNKANRHAAYRQFTLWHHGRLGQGVRMVVPSCCVWAIRDRYPDPYGLYTGFKSTRLA